MQGRECFFDIEFDTGSREDILSMIARAARAGRTTVLVTPNVDHIVALRTRMPAEQRAAYLSADFFLCDSKIIGRLARWSGIALTPRTGTDRVADILAAPSQRDLRIAVVGPTAGQFDALCARYPHHDFVYIPAPSALVRGSAEWDACVAHAAGARWHVLLACLSFPKQELFACDVRARRRGGGIVMCVGAAVDFLSGTQRRAPESWQRHGFEWLHRLLTDPRRLWRRYLVEGPKIFLLYWQYRQEKRA